jgi:type IV pilus assembly protein PilY1
MPRGIFSGKVTAPLPVCYLAALLLLLYPLQAGAGSTPTMQNYCSVPVAAGSGLKPNLLLLLDSSASMYDPAYTVPAQFCVDDSYDDGKEYPGYFEQGARYDYNFASQWFGPPYAPAPVCTVDQGYFCLNLSAT